MSVAFVPERLRGKAEVNQDTLQRLLEENDQLIRCIVEYQSKGRASDCVEANLGGNLRIGFLWRANLPVKKRLLPLDTQWPH